MLTYTLQKAPGVPLYEALYRCIRADILSGALQPGEKLPSKRALSDHLEISKVTVETAYDQLLAEGFIRSQEKVGYFVEAIHQSPAVRQMSMPTCLPEEPALTGGQAEGFPFFVWSRIQRQVMLDMGQALLQPIPFQGIGELRQAIAHHLAAFRGMQVSPEQIVVGAGTDFLYNLLVQLLGREKCYAVEEPGYGKIRRLYVAAGARCVEAPMDGQGVTVQGLKDAQILHISPNHHFPTGLVTPLSRRQALLNWAQNGPERYIIEDDYDSEFRFDAHPMPTLQSLDRMECVIYMNTFSRSLAPSIRIGYMVLPPRLLVQLREKLGFYGCTVPSFDQYTLARFMEQGHFEKHINRMRKFYKLRRNHILSLLKSSPYREKVTVLEENAGLHFLVRTPLCDRKLKKLCQKLGRHIRMLSDYYHGSVPEAHRGCLVVNYGSMTADDLHRVETLLSGNETTENLP